MILFKVLIKPIKNYFGSAVIDVNTKNACRYMNRDAEVDINLQHQRIDNMTRLVNQSKFDYSKQPKVSFDNILPSRNKNCFIK